MMTTPLEGLFKGKASVSTTELHGARVFRDHRKRQRSKPQHPKQLQNKILGFQNFIVWGLHNPQNSKYEVFGLLDVQGKAWEFSSGAQVTNDERARHAPYPILGPQQYVNIVFARFKGGVSLFDLLSSSRYQ